jgi:tight adherence protein B
MIVRVVPAALLAVVAVVAGSVSLRDAPVFIASRRVRRRLRSESLPPVARLSAPIASVGRRVWGSALFGAVRRSVDDRRRQRADRRIPLLLDRVVRQLRSGATIPIALQRVGRESPDPDSRRLAEELRRGRPLVGALGSWRSEDPMPNRQMASVALELAASAGGASARVLDGVAESLRDRVALEREVSALSSQARASAVVLVVAPVGFAICAAMFDHRILDVLVGRPVGWACMVLGLALDLVGAAWMAKMIGRPR